MSLVIIFKNEKIPMAEIDLNSVILLVPNHGISIKEHGLHNRFIIGAMSTANGACR